MNLGGKRVIVAALGVLLIVLAPAAGTWWFTSGPEYKARRLIAELREPGPVREWLIDIGLLERQRDRDEIVHDLVTLGPSAVPGLVRAVADSNANADVRVTAAYVLRRIGRPALPALIQTLKHKDPGTRCRAVRTLEWIGPEAHEAVPALTQALEDRDYHVRGHAAEAIAHIDPTVHDIVPILIRSSRDSSRNLRWRAAWALGRARPVRQEAITALVDLLGDPHYFVQARAAMSLGEIGPAAAPATPALAAALTRKYSFTRWHVAAALHEIGPGAKQAVPALIRALKDDEPFVRSHAAEALGKLAPGDEEVEGALAELLSDSQWLVRYHAAAALARMGHPNMVMHILLKGAKHRDPQVRIHALATLEASGPEAKEGIRAIKEALKDEDEQVRKAAAEALEKIQAAPATRKAG